MAWKSKDGQPFTNRMSQKMHDASLSAQVNEEKAPQDAPQPMGGEDQGGQDQQPQITDDPVAMKLVGKLQQMGYSPDDVANAMGGQDQGQDQGTGVGQEAAQAAPLHIPGLR